MGQLKTRRRYRHEAQARRNGRLWGRHDFEYGRLPGMECFPRAPEWSLKPAAMACWDAFDDGLLQGYLDAAESLGLTTPVEG